MTKLCDRTRFDKSHQSNHSHSVSVGFTVLELLVSIAIVSILMALLLPAIQSSRSAARTLQCKNNLRQLGIAMTGVSLARKRYPASGTFSATGPEGYRSWVHEILPGIDSASLYDRWDFTSPHDVPVNRALGDTHLSVLVCPDDDSVVPGRGNLSYAVNGGFGWTEPVDCPTTMHLYDPSPIWAEPFDLNGDGVTCTTNPLLDTDRQIYFASGMFFLENEPPGTGSTRHHTPDDIIDGLSNTILIAESVRSGFNPAFPNISGWSSPDPRGNGFFLSGYICRNLSCGVGDVDYANANNHSAEPFRFESLNSALTQAEGQAPWPSAYHQGGLNFLFADGRVQFVSELVDGGIYAAAVSPQGGKLPVALAQTVGNSLTSQ